MSASIRKLIADVPSPGSDHGEDEPPTLLEQDLIEIRVVRADLDRRVRNVKLDRPTATGLEVDEERAVGCAEDVAWMRFAVQQLLLGAAVVNLLPRALQRAEEEMPVGLTQCGGLVSARNQAHSLGGSFREGRRRSCDGSHVQVQAMQRVCVLDR